MRRSLKPIDQVRRHSGRVDYAQRQPQAILALGLDDVTSAHNKDFGIANLA
jgi:hypothetical protein